MTRHSKNANALGVFTYQEKQKLKNIYGTLSGRVGKKAANDPRQAIRV
jgi:hypothetical protein